MSDIAQLTGTYDQLLAQLRGVEGEQANTRPGTDHWWELQAAIGDLRRRATEANVTLLEAKIAGGGNSAQLQSWHNELYWMQSELTKVGA